MIVGSTKTTGGAQARPRTSMRGIVKGVLRRASTTP